MLVLGSLCASPPQATMLSDTYSRHSMDLPVKICGNSNVSISVSDQKMLMESSLQKLSIICHFSLTLSAEHIPHALGFCEEWRPVSPNHYRFGCIVDLVVLLVYIYIVCVDRSGSLSGGAFNQLRLATLNVVLTILYSLKTVLQRSLLQCLNSLYKSDEVF